LDDDFFSIMLVFTLFCFTLTVIIANVISAYSIVKEAAELTLDSIGLY